MANVVRGYCLKGSYKGSVWSIVDSKLTGKLRDLVHPLTRRMVRVAVKYKPVFINKCEPPPGHPVIFAVNHQQMADSPMMDLIPERRTCFLIGKQRLDFVSKLFFALQGTIVVELIEKGAGTRIGTPVDIKIANIILIKGTQVIKHGTPTSNKKVAEEELLARLFSAGRRLELEEK